FIGSAGGTPTCHRRRRSTHQRRRTHTAYMMLPATAPATSENPNACQIARFSNTIAQLQIFDIWSIIFCFSKSQLNCVL
uniref:Uncharacterized protein n=1 Tax=Oryza brachyantha TaxID=4533 RepID=J3N5H2_ORYBR